MTNYNLHLKETKQAGMKQTQLLELISENMIIVENINNKSYSTTIIIIVPCCFKIY